MVQRTASSKQAHPIMATAAAHPLVNGGTSADHDRHPGSASSSSTARTSATFQSVSDTTITTTSSGVPATASGGVIKADRGQSQAYRDDDDDDNDDNEGSENQSNARFDDPWDDSRSRAPEQVAKPVDDHVSPITKGNSLRGPSSPKFSAQQQSRRWSSSRYQRYEDDDSFTSAQEDTPIQYPPMSEDDKEARVIEQNLGRWAAEEKQRRKAARSSRASSVLLSGAGASPTASLSPATALTRTPSKLAKRFSQLGRPTLADVHRDSISSTGSSTEDQSRISGSIRSARSADASTLEDVPEVEDGAVDAQEERRRQKGKDRAPSDSNPFNDSSSSSENTVTERSRSLKPTARKPIVTPGRAPTIRHRAVENARRSGGTGRMPSIVATDTDQEEAENNRLQRATSSNPFSDAAERAAGSEVDSSGRPSGAHVVLQHGDDEYGGTMPPTPHSPRSARNRPSMLRKSTSSSRFNEVGLDDDGSPTGWPSEEEDTSFKPGQMGHQQRMSWRQHQSDRDGNVDEDEDGQRRKPWWTEWLCGCDTMQDPDEEQVSARAHCSAREVVQ